MSVIRVNQRTVLITLVAGCFFLYSTMRISSYLNSIPEDIFVRRLEPMESEVPVVICDEHQEVIPYWYQAAEEGIISKGENTLIHIDAHSDMATPIKYEGIRDFEHKYPRDTDEIHNFLPLMQANDVFIVSAIAKGLINRVIWVQPTWLHESRFVRVFNSYVGWTTTQEGEKTFCECNQAVSVKHKRVDEYQCSYLDRDLEPDENNLEEFNPDINIPKEQCEKIRDFRMMSLNGINFQKYIDLRKVHNMFVDIDEDFFGVESGVQAFMDHGGFSLSDHNWINVLLQTLICPLTISGEKQAEKQLKLLFKDVVHMKRKRESKSSIRYFVESEMERLNMKYKCTDDRASAEDTAFAAKNLTEIIILLPEDKLTILSDYKYCLRLSPVLEEEPQFTICSGNIFPGDPLNQIYVGPNKVIEQRAANLTNLLKFINSKVPIKFVSVARSLRDGYTPRNQQRQIEESVLDSLKKALAFSNSVVKLKYDKYLALGQEGWVA